MVDNGYHHLSRRAPQVILSSMGFPSQVASAVLRLASRASRAGDRGDLGDLSLEMLDVAGHMHSVTSYIHSVYLEYICLYIYI